MCELNKTYLSSIKVLDDGTERIVGSRSKLVKGSRVGNWHWVWAQISHRAEDLHEVFTSRRENALVRPENVKAKLSYLYS